MIVLLLCFFVLVGFYLVWAAIRAPYKEIKDVPNLWLVEILGMIIEKVFKVSSEKVLRICLLGFGCIWSLFFLYVIFFHQY